MLFLLLGIKSRTTCGFFNGKSDKKRNGTITESLTDIETDITTSLFAQKISKPDIVLLRKLIHTGVVELHTQKKSAIMHHILHMFVI